MNVMKNQEGWATFAERRTYYITSVFAGLNLINNCLAHLDTSSKYEFTIMSIVEESDKHTAREQFFTISVETNWYEVGKYSLRAIVKLVCNPSNYDEIPFC